MKKNSPFGIWSIVGIVIGYIAIFRLLKNADAELLSGLSLPAGFPSITGLLVIWGILFLIWALGCRFVFTVQLRPRLLRNIFLNGLILVIGIFMWNFLIFVNANLSGALAVNIGTLVLSIVIWFMYLVTHRYGGYLFTSMIVWQVYTLYLSIALVVKN
jgi:tryptophan-rich sensory protein